MHSGTQVVSRHLIEVCLQKEGVLPHLLIMVQRKHFNDCLNGKCFVYTGDNSQLLLNLHSPCH